VVNVRDRFLDFLCMLAVAVPVAAVAWLVLAFASGFH
jgi:hypothetical protein